MTVNQEISVDLEYLIGVVVGAFYSSEEFRKKARAKPLWKRTDDEKRWISHLSDREDDDWGTVYNICKVIGIDQERLISIARLIRKWEVRHSWQPCFPVDSHAEKIMKFILKK